MKFLRTIGDSISEETSDAVEYIGLHRFSFGILATAWLIFASAIGALISKLQEQENLIFLVILAAATSVIIFCVTVHHLFKKPTQITPDEFIYLTTDLKIRRSYWIKPITDQQDLDQAHKLTEKMFPNRHPDFDRINRSYANFSIIRSILLLKKASEKSDDLYYGSYPLGFASFWPLTDDAGAAMKSGLLDEEDIEPEHFSTSESAANYIYIPAITTIDATKNHQDIDGFSNKKTGIKKRSAFSATILRIGMLEVLLERYFIEERPRKVIIDLWSNSGKNELKNFFKHVKIKVTEINTNKKHPTEEIITITVTASDVRRARDNLIRRFAGIDDIMSNKMTEQV